MAVIAHDGTVFEVIKCDYGDYESVTIPAGNGRVYQNAKR